VSIAMKTGKLELQSDPTKLRCSTPGRASAILSRMVVHYVRLIRLYLSLTGTLLGRWSRLRGAGKRGVAPVAYLPGQGRVGATFAAGKVSGGVRCMDLPSLITLSQDLLLLCLEHFRRCFVPILFTTFSLRLYLR